MKKLIVLLLCMTLIVGCGALSNKTNYNDAVRDISQSKWDSAIKHLDAITDNDSNSALAFKSRVLKSILYLAMIKNAGYQSEIYSDFATLHPDNKTLSQLQQQKENLKRRYLTLLNQETSQIIKQYKSHTKVELNLAGYKTLPFDATQVTRDFLTKNFNQQNINQLAVNHQNYTFAAYLLILTGQKGEVLDKPLKGEINFPVYFSLLSKVFSQEEDKGLKNTGQELNKLVLSTTGKNAVTVLNEFSK